MQTPIRREVYSPATLTARTWNLSVGHRVIRIVRAWQVYMVLGLLALSQGCATPTPERIPFNEVELQIMVTEGGEFPVTLADGRVIVVYCDPSHNPD